MASHRAGMQGTSILSLRGGYYGTSSHGGGQSLSSSAKTIFFWILFEAAMFSCFSFKKFEHYFNLCDDYKLGKKSSEMSRCQLQGQQHHFITSLLVCSPDPRMAAYFEIEGVFLFLCYMVHHVKMHHQHRLTLSISLTIYLTKATGGSFTSATYMSDVRKPEIFIMAR